PTPWARGRACRAAGSRGHRTGRRHRAGGSRPQVRNVVAHAFLEGAEGDGAAGGAEAGDVGAGGILVGGADRLGHLDVLDLRCAPEGGEDRASEVIPRSSDAAANVEDAGGLGVVEEPGGGGGSVVHEEEVARLLAIGDPGAI